MMQQQIRTQTPKKNKPAASLIISWLIILGVYLLLRLVFVIFGFHLAPVVLGGCLAVLPYIAGAFYLFKTPAAHRIFIVNYNWISCLPPHEILTPFSSIFAILSPFPSIF